MRAIALTIAALAIGVACGRSEPPSEVAPPDPAAQAAADAAVQELKAAARKLLAADKAVVANLLGYEQAIEKHHRDMRGAGMPRRMPDQPITADALRPRIQAHARQYGLELVKFKLATPAEGAPLPATHGGPGPYHYDIAQIIAQIPVVIEVKPSDEAKLRPFFLNLRQIMGPLPDLVTLRVQDDRALLYGTLYQRRDISPPRMKIHTPTRDELAAKAGVTLPANHPGLAEVDALLEEHRELHPELSRSIMALGQAHLLGTQFQFYRQRMEAVEKRPLPKPMAAAPTTPGSP